MRVVRPVWRRFVPRFYERAVSWVRAGGHALIVHGPRRQELLLTSDEDGEISEQGTWAVLALEQQRTKRIEAGPARGLFSAMVRPHARDAVADWCERDSVIEAPVRVLELDCLECGACCHEANVILYEDDLDRFREAGRPDLASRAYVRRARDGKVTLRFAKGGRCQHLLADNKCNVYALRPFNCRVFPVGSEACLVAREGTLGVRDGAPQLR